MDAMGGGNGQWVRARSKAGAESFAAEKRADADRGYAARRREREILSAVVARVRSWLRR